MAEILLAKNADVNITNDDLWTPLNAGFNPITDYRHNRLSITSIYNN